MLQGGAERRVPRRRWRAAAGAAILALMRRVSLTSWIFISLVAGILIGAFVIRYTGWIYIDPLLSIAIGLLIIYSAIGIIRESLNILLEGLPEGMNLSDITRAMANIDGVIEVHDLHVWSLGANTHALSSHVLIDDMPPSESSKILTRLNDVLCAFGIHHTTIQFEHVPCFLSDHGCQITESAHSHEQSHQH